MRYLIAFIIFLLTISEARGEDWTSEDKYLFMSYLSLQLADYSQSIQFNDLANREQTYCDKVVEIYHPIEFDCRFPRKRFYVETNPIFRGPDGEFNQSRAIPISLVFDAELFYFADKFPRWRKPLIIITYLTHLIVVNSNHNLGTKATTPVLPIYFTINF